MTAWRYHENRIRDLEDLSRKLIQRVMQLEDRHDKTLRHGKVTDVDPKKQLARMEIGNQDGTTVKSPWLPYGQFAGPDSSDQSSSGGIGGQSGGGQSGGSSGQRQSPKAKYHTPPFVGQQMSVFSPNGEFRQGIILPFTWHKKATSPSQSGDEHVTRWDKLRETRKADQVIISVGAQKDNSDQSQLQDGSSGSGSSGGHGGQQQQQSKRVATINMMQDRMLLRVGQNGGDYTNASGTQPSGADSNGDQGTQRGSLLITEDQFTHSVGDKSTITQTADTITIKVGDGSVTINKDYVEAKFGSSAAMRLDQSHAHLEYGGNVYWIDSGGTWVNPAQQLAPDSK